MLKFANPRFKPVAQKTKEDNAAKDAPLVDAWLLTQTDQKVITLADIKAGLPAIAADLDRETINMIAQQLGMKCLNQEDQTP